MTDKAEQAAEILAPYIDWGTTDQMRMDLARRLIGQIMEIFGDRDDDREHDDLCGTKLVLVNDKYVEGCACELIELVRNDERDQVLWSDNSAQRWYSQGRAEAAAAVRQGLISTGFNNEIGEYLVAAARGAR